MEALRASWVVKVCHVAHMLLHAGPGHVMGRRDAADAAGIDLDEAQGGVAHHVLCHLGIVGALATGKVDGPGQFRQAGVIVEVIAGERLFQPQDARCLERGQTPRGLLHGIFGLGPDRPGVDHQQHVPSGFLAGKFQMGDVRLKIAAVAAPAQLDRPEAPAHGFRHIGLGLFRRLAEQHGGIGGLGQGAVIAQQAVDGSLLFFPQQVPKGDIDAGQRVRRLEQVKAVGLDLAADAQDVGGRIHGLPFQLRTDGFAGRVRHGGHIGRDGDQRRGFAFPPSFQAPRADADKKGILAAVTDVTNMGQGKIKEINRFYFHDDLPVPLGYVFRAAGRPGKGLESDGQATVHMDGLTGHVAGAIAGQEVADAGDLFGHAGPLGRHVVARHIVVAEPLGLRLVHAVGVEGHRRFDEARSDGIDVDVERRQFHSAGPHHLGHGGLGHAVGTAARFRMVPVDGGHVHDLAPVLHLLGGKARRQQRSVDHDVKDAAPFFQGRVQHGRTTEQTGGAHHGVELPAPGLIDQGPGAIHGLLAAEVARAHKVLAGGEFRHQFFKALLPSGIDHDIPAIGREQAGGRLTDAGGSSRDKNIACRAS